MSCNSGKPKGELYRNVEQGKIAGICAGIADYFGWEIWLVRILLVSGVLFGMPFSTTFFIFSYIAAWFILNKAPKKSARTDYGVNENSYGQSQSNQKQHADVIDESIKVKARVWQAGEPAKQALYDISRKFRLLERKVQAMEQYVTSTEFDVSREINKL